MKNIYHKKSCHTGAVKTHLDPPPLHLIKSNLDSKMERDDVKVKLCRNPTLEKLYMYEFKMFLFDNGKPEDFLLFIHILM